MSTQRSGFHLIQSFGEVWPSVTQPLAVGFAYGIGIVARQAQNMRSGQVRTSSQSDSVYACQVLGLKVSFFSKYHYWCVSFLPNRRCGQVTQTF